MHEAIGFVLCFVGVCCLYHGTVLLLTQWATKALDKEVKK